MPERRVRIGKKATIGDLITFIHQSQQLEMPVTNLEVVGDNVYLTVDIPDEDRGKLHDFIKGKIYYQVTKSFKSVK